MSEIPMRDDELPRGSMFVSFHFDPGVVPTHPKTGKPIPPPDCITAVCRPEAVGWAKARLTSLVNSTGWRGEMTEYYVNKEDADEPSAETIRQGVTMYHVEFDVDVLQGKQRPRFGGGHVRTPEETKDAEHQVAIAYKGASIRAYGKVVYAPQYVPVAMRVDCYPEWTKSWQQQLPKWLRNLLPFTKTPDWDNLGKTASDGLNGIAYHDDSQVIAAHVYKHNMEKGVHAHMHVTVEFDLGDE